MSEYPESRKPKKDLLPKVSNEIIESFMGDIDSFDPYETLDQISANNPTLLMLIKEQTTVAYENTGSNNVVANMLLMAALIYKALESQAEADHMNSTFDLKEKEKEKEKE